MPGAIALNPSAGCGCGDDHLACTPCPIPKKDLVASAHHIVLGDGSGTLTWNGAAAWDGSIVIPGSPGTTVTIHMDCSVGLFVRISGGGLVAGCTYPCTEDTVTCLTLADYTCEPFHIHIRFSGPGGSCTGQLDELYIDEP